MNNLNLTNMKKRLEKTSRRSPIKDYGFDDLEDFYENGIHIKQDYEDIDDFEAIVMYIGYSVADRLRLDYEEYIHWAKAQESFISACLFKLIDEKNPDITLEEYKLIDETKTHDSYNRAVKKIASFRRCIEISDTNVENSIPALGKYYIINDQIKNLGTILKEQKKYIKEFWNTFLQQYKTLINKKDRNIFKSKISDIVDCELHAYWSKSKRLLKKYNIKDKSIEYIKNTFFNNIQTEYIIDGIEDAYDELEDSYSDGIDQIGDYYENKANSIEFLGIGKGLKGIAQIIGANVFNSVKDSYYLHRALGKGRKLQNDFDDLVSEIYFGIETQKLYEKFFYTDLVSIITPYCLFIIDGGIENQLIVESQYLEGMEQIGSLTEDEKNDLFVKLLQVFPFSPYIYVFIYENNRGYYDDLIRLNDALGNDKLFFDNQNNTECNTFEIYIKTLTNDDLLYSSKKKNE